MSLIRSICFVICILALIPVSFTSETVRRIEFAQHEATEPVFLVDPFIDTANRRFTYFASACRPFGMVSLRPDTRATGGTWEAGYRYTDDTICWFSHIHSFQLAGIPVLPITGSLPNPLTPDMYRSGFSHDQETAEPGYYSVFLEDYNVQVELTATQRVGFHRYTFPDSETSYILFDLGHEIGPNTILDCGIRMISDTILEGYVISDETGRRPKPAPIFFVAEFDKPFEAFGGWKEEKTTEGIEQFSGTGMGAYVRFGATQDEVIQMKVAVSYCDVQQARLNLNSELSHWDFDQVRYEALQEWNSMLKRIQIEGGTDAQRIKFYTDLFHSLKGRRRVSDVDGKYSDFTREARVIRQIPLDGNGRPRYHHHCFDALWGAQWSLDTLWPIVYPEITRDICNTLVDMYKNGGLIPRGPSGGNYTFVMISPGSTHFLVSAYMKGIRDFNIGEAYRGMVKNHLPGGLMSKAGYEHETCIGGGVEYYMSRGYVPLGIVAEASHVKGASQTLEYSYHDWCLAQMASALGQENHYQYLMNRARNYINLYDTQTGFMRPRLMDGSWLEPFDPSDVIGWVEGNGWHYLWHVPHDVQGLIDLMGGREEFTQRLNAQFESAEESNFLAPDWYAQDFGYVDYGNQPCTFLAHLFNYSGAPWLTQKWVRSVLERAKSDTTPFGGYGGDEDEGLMGSLNVLMAIGLFSVNGGCSIDPVYEISSPIFDRITVRLNPRYYSGDTFVIETINNQPGNIYIQSATLNGIPLNRPWFHHSELAQGGVLRITLGPEPNLDWGSNPEDTPPSR